MWVTTFTAPDGMIAHDYGVMAELPDGPWVGEPDKAQWIDPATNLDCLIVRHRSSGNLCGYVGVPFEHALHGADYSDVDVNVHGGLTFADVCDDERPEGICHVPAPGRPTDVWWFGFDCAHFTDQKPLIDKRLRDIGFEPMFVGLSEEFETYKTFGYVVSECSGLAAQLAALA